MLSLPREPGTHEDIQNVMNILFRQTIFDSLAC